MSPSIVAPVLKGMQVDPKAPFKFNFILDTGTSEVPGFGEVSGRLIRYFLASLTIPEKELWVNLSPYEKDRIIPDELSLTEMGRDLLGQDYILKQITASLIYPENETGKAFWRKVYATAYEKYGSSDIPVDTFNKVWIVPDKAVVYENGTKVFVTRATLKVMLETDYEAASRQREAAEPRADARDQMNDAPTTELAKDIIREVIIPVLEKEVNEGANFAQLRQIYHSLILAKWYKETLKDSIINRAYSDQKKTGGVDLADKGDKQLIYEKYLEALRKGAFDYVKEEYNPFTKEILPIKYFSGGVSLSMNIEKDNAEKISGIGDTLYIKTELVQPVEKISAPRDKKKEAGKDNRSGNNDKVFKNIPLDSPDTKKDTAPSLLMTTSIDSPGREMWLRGQLRKLHPHASQKTPPNPKKVAEIYRSNSTLIPNNNGASEKRNSFYGKNVTVHPDGFMDGEIFDPEFVAWERTNALTATIVFDLEGTLIYDEFGPERYVFLREGILEQLRILKSRGFRLVLWTNTSKHVTRETFVNRYPQAARLFDLFITGENAYPTRDRTPLLRKLYPDLDEEGLLSLKSINLTDAKDIVLLDYRILVDNELDHFYIMSEHPYKERFKIYPIHTLKRRTDSEMMGLLAERIIEALDRETEPWIFSPEFIQELKTMESEKVSAAKSFLQDAISPPVFHYQDPEDLLDALRSLSGEKKAFYVSFSKGIYTLKILGVLGSGNAGEENTGEGLARHFHTTLYGENPSDTIDLMTELLPDDYKGVLSESGALLILGQGPSFRETAIWSKKMPNARKIVAMDIDFYNILQNTISFTQLDEEIRGKIILKRDDLRAPHEKNDLYTVIYSNKVFEEEIFGDELRKVLTTAADMLAENGLFLGRIPSIDLTAMQFSGYHFESLTRYDTGIFKKISDHAQPVNGGIDLDGRMLDLHHEEARGMTWKNSDYPRRDEIEIKKGLIPVIIEISPLLDPRLFMETP